MAATPCISFKFARVATISDNDFQALIQGFIPNTILDNHLAFDATMIVVLKTIHPFDAIQLRYGELMKNSVELMKNSMEKILDGLQVNS
ncbi:hypothetical protein [Larkinella rosea]|uniref:Uncharacterized protein n=1 Tax=Larkinella rosea TaxID=2025312 RepID=A0A3P1BI29_9BACT|nr:hypothetical protein [Larkinella rosea]RRB00668.1 hypothetical protein EHT25_20955 [Larkinella rosea]